MKSGALVLLGLSMTPPVTGAQPAASAPSPAERSVHIDTRGVLRWSDDRSEVALFGANYIVHTASDYRAAGYVAADRKRLIDEDMAHFARMGWDGLRLTFWGDWEASDSAGKLLANDHLDLLDYLIARAKERGIYMLLSPIQLYSSNWPDVLERDPATPGFGRVFGKARMGTDPAALAAQVNYLRQILGHVNPYTGTRLKDEPAILFIELVNEPWHHPEDRAGSIRYLNTLTDAVRSTGCRKPVFYNVSQDFRTGEAIRRSRVQGITFGWYPTGLNAGYELQGNYLRTVDAFPDLLRPELATLPRIVYEFDSPDLRNATMYPAMARTFRAVGAQFAAMFAYDMLGTASRNLGWQTHYLNLVYTPRKAMSAIIAAEAMRRLPRMRTYGPYPQNTRFGDFRISADEDLSELVARDAFLHAGSTDSRPPEPAFLTRVYGVGSSTLVAYQGLGSWFLDRVRPGVWRLEVYPDAVPLRDPFEPPNPDKIVTRTISRPWPMTITLPDLGQSFTVQAVTPDTGPVARAQAGRITVTPGVYVLSRTGPVELGTMPGYVGRVAFREYHGPQPDSLPFAVQPLTAPEYLAGRDAELQVQIVGPPFPDSATLYLRRVAGDFYRGYPLRQAGPFRYAARIPGSVLREGPSEFVVTVFTNGRARTFPQGLEGTPWRWDYYGRASWTLAIVDRTRPLVLFDPERDAGRLAFTRIGDAGRRGLFQVQYGPSGRAVFHLELPVDSSGWSPPDYTASLVVKDRIRSRGEAVTDLDSLRVRLRGLAARQRLVLTLMEDDGTSWTTTVEVDSTWTERTLPLASFTSGRGVLLPQGFPGRWLYWVDPAAGRGSSTDRIKLERLERIQFSLRRGESALVRPGYGVEVEYVLLKH
ncbi:MAG: hypothetical protein ACT4PM_03640 [Gemmatimonadales bacterium]